MSADQHPIPDEQGTATPLARSVVAGLVRAGVAEVVLSPGSRNAPLSFALWQAARAGLLRLHTRIDERSAAFLALGLSKVGARAAVVCTSGSAVANLHPAILEALHARVGLVAVTADRPARFRGTTANQTTEQVGLFGPHVPVFDLSRATEAWWLAEDQPTHLNVQLEEPLLPPSLDDRDWLAGLHRPTPGERRPSDGPAGPLDAGPRTVVVAGDDAGPPARVLAEQAGWPLLAEPSSGARTGANALRCYRLLLDGDLGRQVERVVVFGHPTLSRPVTRLLTNPHVEVWAQEQLGPFARRPFPVAHTFAVAPAAPVFDDGAWLAAWHEADERLGRDLDTLLASEPELTPHEVAGAVARALPEGGLLAVGASSPIRDLDLMVPRYRVGARRKVIASRGLAGIDGTVSTALGAALGRPQSTRALALMGDVTFLHDSNGLILGPHEARPDLTVVVVNDDGGSIFAMLEQGGAAYAPAYEALFGTPHHVDLAALCAAVRVPHLRVTSLPELEQALGSPNGGVEVIEAVVRRDNRRDLDDRIRALGASTPAG